MKRSPLRLAPVLLLAAAIPAPPGAAEEPRPREAPRPAGKEAPAPAGLPWKPGVEYRYIWIRDGRKAGETRFGLEEHARGAERASILTATRTYDWEGSSQRARSTTTVRGGGEPLAFDEALEVRGLQNLRSHQLTEVRVEGGKARVKYVHNGKEDTPRLLELDVPAGAFLCGNQAVEHWAIFASRLPRTEGRHVLELLYPDHAKVLSVAFEKAGEETLKLGAEEAAASRFRFVCREARLEGSIWLDPEGRMLQVEFLGGERKEPVLRVVLEKKP